MPSTHKDKPRSDRVRYKDGSSDPFHAPYEKPDGPSVPYQHGGYAIRIAEGYVEGPYFYYQNALTRCSDFIGGIVVRWVDFVEESTNDERFRRKFMKCDHPFTVRIKGLHHKVHFHP